MTIDRTWLKLVRIKNGRSQTQVAAATGMSPQTYSLIENGGQNISVTQAKKIAKFLEIDWQLFFSKTVKFRLVLTPIEG